MAVGLDYSRTHFAGGYRYRSVKTVLGVVGALGMALATLLLARRLPAPGPWRMVGYGVVALLCGVAGLLGLWALIDRNDAFSLTTAGIIENGRLTAWQDVREFAAEGRPDGRAVRLFFVAHGPVGKVHHLHLSRPLTPREYERRIGTLRAELAELYPRLRLGGFHTDGT